MIIHFAKAVDTVLPEILNKNPDLPALRSKLDRFSRYLEAESDSPLLNILRINLTVADPVYHGTNIARKYLSVTNTPFGLESGPNGSHLDHQVKIKKYINYNY